MQKGQAENTEPARQQRKDHAPANQGGPAQTRNGGHPAQQRLQRRNHRVRADICDRLRRKARACSGNGAATSPAAWAPAGRATGQGCDGDGVEEGVTGLNRYIVRWDNAGGGEVQQFGPAFTGDPDAVKSEFGRGAVLLGSADLRGQVMQPVTHLAPRLRARD